MPGVIKYYYFTDNPLEQISWMNGLEKDGFILLPARDGEENKRENLFKGEDQAKVIYTIQKDPFDIVVVKLENGNGWEKLTQEIFSLEREHLNREGILAEILVLATSEPRWEESLMEAQRLVNGKVHLEMKKNQVRLARLNWLWPDKKAIYFANIPGGDLLNPVSGNWLPVLEAKFLQLQLQAEFYRDRRNSCNLEKEELDRSLSDVLHSRLVRSGQEAVDDLSEQVHLISTNFAILAGLNIIIREALQKMYHLAGAVDNQLEEEGGCEVVSPLKSITSLYEGFYGSLEKLEQEIVLSMQNHKAAIEVVRSRIEIFLSRENIKLQAQIKDMMDVNNALQKQNLTFQLAASLIAFILVSYYSHSLWKNLVPLAYQNIHNAIQFIFVLLFSASVIYITHLIGEYIQVEKDQNRSLLIRGLVLVAIIITVIITGSIIYNV